MSEHRPRFIVGTGRCGSTLLARLVGSHREVAAIHECFTGLDWGRRFAPGLIGARDLADLLSADQPVTTTLLGLGYDAPEITYPFDSGTRWQRGEPIPWLLVSMATPLSAHVGCRFRGDPDALHEALIEWALRRPAATMGEHHRAMLDWLAATAGRRHWVERSGSSIDYVGDLDRLFPDALFCHIHRDGAEAALSMREHPFFRFAMAMVAGRLPEGAGADDDGWVRDVVEQPTPLDVAGRHWADQVAAGMSARSAIADERWCDIRFEDLLADPSRVVSDVVEFFGLEPDPHHASTVTEVVDPRPRRRGELLTAEESALLSEAVEPGQTLLGRS